MSAYLVVVATSLLVGMGCALAAYEMKRDPLRWFIAGVVLNVFAVLLIAYSESRRKPHGDVRRA